MSALERLRLCGWLCLLPVAPLATRLAWLHIVRHHAFEARVDRSVERQDLEIVPRGRILDRNGRPLAQSLPAWSAFLDLKVLGESDAPKEKVLGRIAEALALDRSDLRKTAASKRRTVWIKRKMSFDEAQRLRGLGLACVGIEADEARSYPNDALARPVLGEVNLDGRGAAGLELAFDSDISGRAVPVHLRRDGAGRSIRQESEAAPPPPELTLTIDRAVQFFAETALDEAITSRKASGGTVIVQDPSNGEILAMAVRPSDSRRNHAVQDVYEPGSTFKLVTAAAALENKVLKDGETVDCENGRWQVAPSVAIKDHDKQGRLGLADIIKHSSNIGTGKIGLRLGDKEFFRFARLFGFGYRTGVPLPGESPGLIPSESVPDVSLANAAFGQGVAVTALQLSAAYAAVANGGTLYEPRLVLSVGGAPAREPVVVRRVASPETVAALQKMLVSVVEGGTGVSARVPGYSAAGKTGTAQKIDPATRKYSPTDYVASFAGWVPAQRPRWSILVVVDTPRVGYYAAEVAAPVFSRIARQLLALKGVPPELPLQVKARDPAKPAAPAPAARPSVPRVPPLPRPTFMRQGPRAEQTGAPKPARSALL
ncbi:MAG: penicillin-binding protein 2 [Elusimicrobia bacterium]|nr:penicillin-binding protein 2 [Elusimicrobiota bacterium]